MKHIYSKFIGKRHLLVMAFTVCLFSNALQAGAKAINEGSSISSHTATIAPAPPSTNDYLSYLKMSQGKLSPVFAQGTASYSASVGNAITSLTVTPYTADPTATVKVNGVAVTSGTASTAITLNVGANIINTVVTAQDGVTTQTYTITVSRAASSNAYLLFFWSQPVMLSTGFDYKTFSYSGSVSNAISSVTIQPSVLDTTATVKVDGTTVANKAVSNPIPLAVGANTISIVVTAQDGVTTQTYMITITRAPSSNAYLQYLSVQTATLSPGFAFKTFGYTTHVPNSTASVTVTSVVLDPTATVKVNGAVVANKTASAPIPLAVGSNTITLVVTAQDGITTQTYVITIARQQGITAGIVSGNITACAGMASASPAIKQFTVSASGLTANITATAPANFEVSLAPGSGYGNSVILAQTRGIVNASVYVRSAATALAGNISGNVVLTSAGDANLDVAVMGIVNALPTVNLVPNQTVTNGAATTAVNFTGTGDLFSWINDAPDVGLAASGTGNIAPFTAVNTGASPVAATITATPANAAHAYIVSFDSTVSVINTATNMVTATIAVGGGSDATAVSPDGSRLYIPDVSANNISVVNTATNTVISTIPTGGHWPRSIAVSPDGTRLYVAFSGPPYGVSVISTLNNAVIATISLTSNAVGIALTPDGGQAYVTGENIWVINTVTNTLAATITQTPFSTNFDPTALVVSPDGSKVYVANEGDNSVTVINTATNTISSTFAIGPQSSLPLGIAINADGSRLYVTKDGANAVAVINTAANTVVANVPVGAAPFGVSISPDGKQVYVENTGSNSVSVISTTNNTVVATVAVATGSGNYGNFIAPGTGCSGPPTTFTITVNPSNANLSNLAISAGTLTPTFAAGTTGYTDAVANATAAVTVTPTVADATSTIKVNGTTVASGMASASIPLAVGANTINTVVTAQDGTTTKTYTITVTRAASGADSYIPIAIGTGISVTQTTETPILADDGIIVHQGISPNGDGINDFLQIDNITQYPNNKLAIMNRGGQLIYEATGYNNSSKAFDGHSSVDGQKQLPGTYFYQLDYTVNGIAKRKTGFIVLKY